MEFQSDAEQVEQALWDEAAKAWLLFWDEDQSVSPMAGCHCYECTALRLLLTPFLPRLTWH